MRSAPAATRPLLLVLLAVALMAARATAARAPEARPASIVAEQQEPLTTLKGGVRVGPRLVEKPLVFPGALMAAAARHEGGGEGLPIVDPPERVAGYFQLNRTYDAHMFYLYYAPRHPSGRALTAAEKARAPVVLWMTGGPGCSSEIAVLYENGPYTLAHNLTLLDNPYGWDAAPAHVVYVDQPINTGFSYSDDPRDRVYSEKLVADDMLDFFQAFYTARPELAQKQTFITGESYAGKYVPSVSARLWRAAHLGEGDVAVRVAGVAIGNGLTVPGVQFGAYADFALQEGLISKGYRDSIQWFMPLCSWGSRQCDRTKWGWVCSLTLYYCQTFIFARVLAANPGINVYDIRKQCEGPLCYDFSDADAFLNSDAVRKALGVPESVQWSECNMGVHADFTGDFMRDVSHKLVPLLEDNVPVMIYAGDKDLICNHVGNRRWVDGLAWSGQADWAQAKDEDWGVEGGDKPAAGSVASSGPLSFVRIFDAGHMAPRDQPEPLLYMISRFIYGKPLVRKGAGEGEGGEVAGAAVSAAAAAAAAASPSGEKVAPA